MTKINQSRLSVWIYKFLLGTLSKEKTRLLEKELRRREKENQISCALERKLLAAFIVNGSTREYLAVLLDDWEKRNWGD